MLSPQEILSRLDFVALLEECGFEGVEAGKSTFLGHCVFHTDVRTKSFSANLDSKLFHCFSSACGVQGNGIHLYALRHDISFREAVAQLSERFELQVKPRDLGLLRVPTKQARSWTRESQVLTSFWRESPILTEQMPVAVYLGARGFDLFDLKDRVRAVDPHVALPKLVQTFGLAALIETGLLSIKSTSELWIPSFHYPAALFPFFLGEQVVYYQTRSILPGREPKYLNPAGRNPPCLYNHDALQAAKDVVYVAEGPIDALSLEVLGYSPAVALLGTSSFSDSWLSDFRCKRIVLCLDKDKAGAATTADLVAKFLQRGIEVSIWDPVVKVKDVNEFLLWKKNQSAAPK